MGVDLLRDSLFIFMVMLIVSAGSAVAASPCSNSTECNVQGSRAYQEKKYQKSLGYFIWQLRYAELSQEGGVAAQELALNNLILANLKVGDLARARLWMEVALLRGFEGQATKYNTSKVKQMFSAATMPGVQGYYERYAGMGEWETLAIEPHGQGGNVADFSMINIGNPASLVNYGPVAVGRLTIRLEGKGTFFRAAAGDLEKGCKLEISKNRLDLNVVESLKPECQSYGGMGVYAAGVWRKVAQVVMNDSSNDCVRVRSGEDEESVAGNYRCMRFSYEQRHAAQMRGLDLGMSFLRTNSLISQDGWVMDEVESSGNEIAGGSKVSPVCGQGFDAVCQMVVMKEGVRMQLEFSGTNEGLPLIGVDLLVGAVVN